MLREESIYATDNLIKRIILDNQNYCYEDF